MPLPPLQPVSTSHFYSSGDVTIHPNAAIAPGVLLQADPGSQLVIGSGVCVGLGTVLHAQQGTLEIDSGASLGSGVLIVGSGKIGMNACVGSMATIFNCSIEPNQVIAPGSLIGDVGRQVPEPQAQPEAIGDSEPCPSDASTDAPLSPPAPLKPPVYGKDSFNGLMTSLFPHRQSFNSQSSDLSPTEPSSLNGSS